jgi:hypothetical protein
MATALFIDIDYIKATSLIDDNVEDTIIMPTVEMVQDIYMHPILGTKLYEDLQTMISAATVSAAYQTLLNNYIAPCMKYYVMHEITTWLNVKYRNKGVVNQRSDNSQNIDFYQQRMLAENWKDKAEIMAQRTTNFLCANQSDYPKYLQNSEMDDIAPNGNNFTSSLYLGNGLNLPTDIPVFREKYGK